MVWPIGYGKPSIEYRGEPESEVRANGVPVTDPNGFVEVRARPSALALGAPPIASIRLRVRADVHGKPYLFAGEVCTGGRRYPGVHALDGPWVSAWLASLPDAIHAEIDRRVERAARETSPLRRVLASSRWVTEPRATAATTRKRRTGSNDAARARTSTR